MKYFLPVTGTEEIFGCKTAEDEIFKKMQENTDAEKQNHPTNLKILNEGACSEKTKNYERTADSTEPLQNVLKVAEDQNKTLNTANHVNESALKGRNVGEAAAAGQEVTKQNGRTIPG